MQLVLSEVIAWAEGEIEVGSITKVYSEYILPLSQLVIWAVHIIIKINYTYFYLVLG